MIEYLLIAGVITAVVVFVGKFLLKINLIPVLMAFTLVAFGVNPLTYHVGSEIAKDQASTFNEYWNGFETAATKTVRECTYNGSCSHTYDCDPYTVYVPVTTTDSKGNSTTTMQPETRYNSCPVSTQESSYYISSTVDKKNPFVVAANLMTGPEFRAYERRIPGGQQGDPALWTEAKARLDAGQPGPVTAVKTYMNYILASQDTLFENYSDRIEDLKSKNLLPTPSAGVFALYQASKAYKVGNANVPLFGDYVTDVSYLNGAVGEDLHGDLHVIFAPEDIEGGKDDYTNAVLAYWQSKELKRDAVSKNSIIVVIGASKDGQKVSWAKAMTGMPIGNEHLMVQLASDLKDKPLDKDLLGRPSFDIASKQVKASNGVLESVLWGVNKFERVSMTANGADDKGSGFMYLRDQMKPSGWEIFWISFVNILIAGLVLFGSLMLIVSDVLPSRFFSWKGSTPSYKPSSDLFGYSAYGTTKKKNPYADLYDSGFLSRDGKAVQKKKTKSWF
jgi:hypothetical protein